MRYCNSLTSYKRRRTEEVVVGNLPMGGKNPIRLQSMTTTDTMDTEATVAQSIRLADAGCEYVRITAPSIKEAENLRNIKKSLLMNITNRTVKTSFKLSYSFKPTFNI